MHSCTFVAIFASILPVCSFSLLIALFVKGQQEIGLYAIRNIPEQTELFFNYYKHSEGTTTTTKLARMKNKWTAKPK